jgi:hypothetical protein
MIPALNSKQIEGIGGPSPSRFRQSLFPCSTDGRRVIRMAGGFWGEMQPVGGRQASLVPGCWLLCVFWAKVHLRWLSSHRGVE